MSDSVPSSEDFIEEIQSSDRFAERVEEIAEHFHEDAYKDDRIPEIKASFREDAEDAGLSEGGGKGVAGHLIGTLMQRAGEKAPPPPESKWDALEPEGGPLPKNRYEELPGPLFRLLRLVETEEKPFRQVHRLIDAVEWAVKWHTTLALSDLLAAGDLPDQVKVLLAQSLRTPSLGTWNRFFREATSAFDEVEAEPSLPWTRFERLTDLENEHHLVSFRNQYGHGATPPPEECLQDVEEYFPVLRKLIHSPLFTEVGLAVRGQDTDPLLLTGEDRDPIDLDLPEGHAAALLPEESEREAIDLWPLGITAEAEVDDDETNSDEEPRFFFFNALKNRSVDQLNYEGPVHRRDEGLYDPFFERLPLRAWREEATAEMESFAREVAALTESFKGRRKERARLRGFAASSEGTLMVYGAPGIGKSALLAQVTREIEAGVDADGRELTDENGDPIDPPPVIEYFIRRSEGKNDPTRFLRYLCHRLDERYDLSGQGLGSEPAELQEQLSARLQAIEQNADSDEDSDADDPKRTVLLVDGLDEAPELGRYVPESRPWLPVIVASRETPEAADFYEGCRRETRSTMTVGPLERREVRAILYEGANKYDPAFDEEYVEAVAERSEGNPLYLTLLAEELFQGKIEVGDIDALPEKIGELYGEALRRVTDGGENQTVLDLLHLLAEAKAPLTTEAIAEILDINPMQASSAVRAAMELLHEASPEALYPTEDAPKEAVQLFHESLREWLKEKHGSACEGMRKKLAEKTADWGEHRNETARRYALRYGAVHQREAGKSDELYDLLSAESYQEEQVITFKQYEATFASYEAGLEAYVARDGETPEDDARLCRLALDAGQAAREAKEGISQAFRWAEDGRVEDALQRIEVLDEEKYFLAALRLLWSEADRQAKRPEDERSAKKAEKVLDAVEDRIPPGTEAIDWVALVDKDFMAWWTGLVTSTFRELDITPLISRTSDIKDFIARVKKHVSSGSSPFSPLPPPLKCLLRVSFELLPEVKSESERADLLHELIEILLSKRIEDIGEDTLRLGLEAANSLEWLEWEVQYYSKNIYESLSEHLAALLAAQGKGDLALNLGEEVLGSLPTQDTVRILTSAESMDVVDVVKRELESDEITTKDAVEIAAALSQAGHLHQALEALSHISGDAYRDGLLRVLANASRLNLSSLTEDTRLELTDHVQALENENRSMRPIFNESPPTQNQGLQLLSLLFAKNRNHAQATKFFDRTLTARDDAALRTGGGLLRLITQSVHSGHVSIGMELALSSFDKTQNTASLRKFVKAFESSSLPARFKNTIVKSLETLLADDRIADDRIKEVCMLLAAVFKSNASGTEILTKNQLLKFVKQLRSRLSSDNEISEWGVGKLTHTLIVEIYSALDLTDELWEMTRSTEEFEELESVISKTLNTDFESSRQRKLFQQAIRSAQSTEDTRSRVRKLLKLLPYSAEAGFEDLSEKAYRKALEQARKAGSRDPLHEAYQSSIHLSRVAEEGASFRLTPSAREVLEEAFENAKALDDANQRAKSLESITVSALRLGHEKFADQIIERLIKTLEEADHARSTFSNTREITRELSRKGKGEIMSDLIERIDTARWRARELATAGVCLARRDTKGLAKDLLGRAQRTLRSLPEKKRGGDAKWFFRKVVGGTMHDIVKGYALIGEYDQALDAVYSISDEIKRDGALSDVAELSAVKGNCKFAVDVSLSIGNLSTRSSTAEKIAEQQVESDQANAFAKHLPELELNHDGWTSFLSTWREALLEHTGEPRPLLRESFTLYPFDAEAASEGVYSLVQAHIQAGAMNHAEAVAKACPELELGVLVSEPDLPLPEGCDSDDLPAPFDNQFEGYVEDYKQGDLSDEAFKNKVETLFEMAEM